MADSAQRKEKGYPELATMAKVGYHKEKVNAYLDGQAVFPVTLELDLTSECTRKCSECPSTRASSHHHLTEDFLDKLFGYLGGKTSGLLLTGGEPTMSPLFPTALRMARQRGFSEIAVVTNGSLLDRPDVADALLTHVTTVRLSLYDWDGESCGIETTRGRIESLRQKIDRTNSALQIGVSALTSAERVAMLGTLAGSVRSAGAHWIYFHPLCYKWGEGCPEQTGQEGVIERIGELREGSGSDFRVFMSRERYERTPLEFDGYHAANFLLVVGADGYNYLAPEVKYQPRHIIADAGKFNGKGFLRQRERMEKIASFRGSDYPAVRSRHRGVLYNHLIERLKHGEKDAAAVVERAADDTIIFPHIL